MAEQASAEHVTKFGETAYITHSSRVISSHIKFISLKYVVVQVIYSVVSGHVKQGGGLS